MNRMFKHYIICTDSVADPGFQVRGGALKKIAIEAVIIDQQWHTMCPVWHSFTQIIPVFMSTCILDYTVHHWIIKCTD